MGRRVRVFWSQIQGLTPHYWHVVTAAIFGRVVHRAVPRDIRPDAADAAMLAIGILHRNRRVIGVHDVRREHLFLEQPPQRRQHVGGLGEPAAQRGARDRKTLPGVTLFLTIERQMIDQLRDDHIGHQSRRGLRLRQRFGRQLGDLQFIGLIRVREPHHILRPHDPADEQDDGV